VQLCGTRKNNRKKEMQMKRKISILLALMMAVCMVGAVQITAYAATTAKSVSLSTTTYT